LLQSPKLSLQQSTYSILTKESNKHERLSQRWSATLAH
jgi:hypothetical protein